MPDSERTDKNAASRVQPRKDDSRVPPDPGVGDEQTDAGSQKSTTSRPRGHTEDPDRTL
jgi:hypothetical protein